MGRAKKKIRDNTFLGISTYSIDRASIYKHLIILSLLSILVKIFTVLLTTNIFHSFVDLFDISVYLGYAVKITQGQLPYLDFSFEYPILFLIPVIVPMLPTLLTLDPYTYVLSFQIFATLLDIGNIILVYFIALAIYRDNKAFIAGLLYATAFSSCYFVLTKYDALPTFLLLLSIFLTINHMKNKGYITAVLGFFTKVFPIITIPYYIIFNKESGSYGREILRFVKFTLPVWIIFIVPFMFISQDYLRPYLFATGGEVDVYVNTATNTLYNFLHPVLGIPVALNSVSVFMSILMIAVCILLLIYAIRRNIETPLRLVVFIYLTIFSLIFFTKFHSPQYIVWLAPLLAIILCHSFGKIALFYILQCIVYIEFPLMWNAYYVNKNYIAPVGAPEWWITFIFFTVESIVFLLVSGAAVYSEPIFRKDIQGFIEGIISRFIGQTERQ